MVRRDFAAQFKDFGLYLEDHGNLLKVINRKVVM